MAITKFFKFVTPETHLTTIQDNGGNGVGGLYGNYTWYHSLVYGSQQRLSRYREYDAMDADTDVNVALDLIAEEMVGNTPKNELPLDLVIETGAEQYVSPTAVVTIKAALRTWCKIEEWDTRIFPLTRHVIKYGDCFFVRNNRNKFKKSVFVHPRNVTGACVNELDHTDIRAWQVQFQPLGQSGNTNQSGYKAITSYGNNSEEGNHNDFNEINANDMIWYSLYNDMSDEAPFGVSVLRAIYKTFKQKELLEDAILIYRIQRAPEKRVFNVEVGKGTPPNVGANLLENMRNEIKQKRVPSANGGKSQVDSVYNPQTANEDYFFIKRDGIGSSVEILPGGQNLGELQDLEYFYKKMWRGLRIPQSYMDSNTESSQPSSDGKVGIAYQQEIMFTLYIERLQKSIEKTLDAEFKRFLEGANVKVDTTLFRIKLPTPTSYKESRDNAINADLVSTYVSAMDIGPMSARFGLAKYLGWTQEEIATNERMKRQELGLATDGGEKDLPMIYNPEAAEQRGFDGGMGGSTGMIGDDMGLGGDEGGEGEDPEGGDAPAPDSDGPGAPPKNKP